ncbi:N-dimethylarginine dimethylaminohydrolase [Streptomyces sp. V4I2]|nr:N-dimethylarginine dimethylaminohydrolase [Streptomyces sp. V4I2]
MGGAGAGTGRRTGRRVRYPRLLIERAQHELDQFIALLQSLGVTVRRPDAVDHRRRFGTPDWSSRGFCTTCPRDSMLVIGDEIIETPMAWPCRYFETHSYRTVLKDYLRRGARWTAAPKPQLTDELFEADFRVPEAGEPVRYILTEFEPVFDAADFVRAGRDLFVTRSNVTNRMGIDWLRRHLGPGYRIHAIEGRCRTPMHIDTTFVPLAPGKALVSPECIDVDRLPEVLSSWDILIAPEPDPIDERLLKITSMCRRWAQHEHAGDRREAGDRGAAPHRHAARARSVGVRADPVRPAALRAVRRIVPLRDTRHPSARHARVVRPRLMSK